MIIANISRVELLNLCETCFGKKVLLCFNSYQSLNYELDNFINFLKDNQIEYTSCRRTGKITLTDSELIFKVVQDFDVKEKLAGILISSVILNNAELSNDSLYWLQYKCRMLGNREIIKYL